jgi:alpha-mannosidase
VYEDAEVLFAEIKRDAELLVEEAFNVLIPNSVPLTRATTSKPLSGSCKIVAYNTTFFPRWEIIKVPSLTKAGSWLKSLILQASSPDDGISKEGYAIMHCDKGAGLGELKSPSNALHAHLKPVSSKAFQTTTHFFLYQCLFINIFSIYQRI